MINIKKVVMVFLIPIITGCDFNVTDVQYIDINHYAENDKNVELAKDLMYYDPRYIALKVPAFDENTSKGIHLGYFIRSSDGKLSYRVTYSLKNPSVVSHLDDLKKQFEEFIPKLAAFHVSKGSVFKELEPKGEAWIFSLFSEPTNRVYEGNSSILKENMTQEKFVSIANKISKEYGRPKSIDYVRAQYYESVGLYPESASLYYSTSFKQDKSLMIRISLVQEQQQWLAMGFSLEQI